MQLSSEQELFINTAMEGHNVLVDACIGSGKTTAIQHLCEAYPPKVKILYLTYNRLLKIDARSKIKKRNVTVTNYHGYAYSCLRRMNMTAGLSDMIQVFLREHPPIAHYDVLVIDEYQDIEQELANMLQMIKDANPGIQIVAVGDMMQKIYDKTTLNVQGFITGFLGEHVTLEFTQCFRLSADHAAMLGRVWNKKIVGVNPNCKIEVLPEEDIVRFLSEQDTKDVLCLGARTGQLSKVLNRLEEEYPERFNKHNVYASIAENDSLGATEPTSESAIFTTYDSSKGLERKIAVIFDWTESYWLTRARKPQQSYEILRNIFCVAASRGKDRIIFVEPDEAMLSEQSLSHPADGGVRFENMEISDMFEFKYKEDIEECFSLIKTKKIQREDTTIINITNRDGLIDLSPCIGIYQEAMFFDGYDIEESIRFHLDVYKDKKGLYKEELQNASLEKKILFLTSMETSQNRYLNQVEVPFIGEEESKAISDRLSTVFRHNESVQSACAVHFSDHKNGSRLFSALGMMDVVKEDMVYELKFVSELQHEHFLQCAVYLVATGMKKGILWNVRTNEMYEVSIPSVTKFMNAVTNAITKNDIERYYKPNEAELIGMETMVRIYDERKNRAYE